MARSGLGLPVASPDGTHSIACDSSRSQEHAVICHSEPQQAAHSSSGSDDNSSNGSDDVIPPTMTGVMRDLLSFALPMLATLAADPLASLVDTAFVGRLGSIPLAGTGLGVSIFNSVTRLVNAPLLAVTTSAIAAAQAAAATAAVPSHSECGCESEPVDSPAAVAAAAAGTSAASCDVEQQQQAGTLAGGPAAHAVLIAPASSCGSEPSSSPDLMLLVSDESSPGVQPSGRPGQAVTSKPPVTDTSSPMRNSSRVCGTDAHAWSKGDGALAAWFPGSMSSSSSSSSPGDDSRRLLDSTCAPESATAEAASLQGGSCSGAAGGASSTREAAEVPCPYGPGSALGSAVSACLLLAGVFGTVQAVLLTSTADATTQLWGAPTASPLHLQALRFLLVRGGLAPVTILLLVLQGIYRGMRDTITPLWATVGANALNLALLPPLIFSPLNWGVAGSAAATGASEALPVLLLIVILVVRYRLRLSLRQVSMQQVAALFAPTGLLVLRTASVMAVYAVATAVVARGGPTAAAAHQVAFQVWLAASLLADSLAVASQTLVATVTAAGHLPSARMVVRASMLLSLTLGSFLGVLLAAGSTSIPALFTADPQVQGLARRLMPLVAITQPINALAFVLDGILYGVGGFKYASAVMVVCAAPALGLMVTGLVLHQIHPPTLVTPPGWDLAARRLLLSGAGVTVEAWQQRKLPWAVLLQTHLCGGCWDMVGDSTATATYATPTTTTTSSSSSSSHWSWLSSSRPPTQATGGPVDPLSPPPSSQLPGQPLVQLLGWPAAAGIGSFPTGLGGHLSRASPEVAVSDPTASMSLVWWAWSGLVVLMVMRVVTIYLPYALRVYPFTGLFTDLARADEDDQAEADCSQPRATAAAAGRPASIIRLVRAFQSMTGWRAQGLQSGGAAAQQRPDSSRDAYEEGGIRQPLLTADACVSV